jgi:ribosome maturation factor RimP
MHAGDDGALRDRFIREAGLASKVAELIEPALQDRGFRLVRVAVSGREGKTLQVMAERPDGTLTIEDCETISRDISPLLDVHDPIAGAYRLEVSSPGIDRPLVRPSDFEDWSGYEAKIETKEPIDGRKRFRGMIEGFSDGEVRIEVDIAPGERGVIGLPVDLIGEAKLMLTDELIREALRRAKKNDEVGSGDA